MTSKSPQPSPDHDLNSNVSLSEESWMDLFKEKSLCIQNQSLILNGFQDHPEWVNQRNKCQQTPLIVASVYGCVEVVKALILLGAHLNEKDIRKRTALMMASAEGDMEVVKVLIQAGVDLNLQEQDGWTALMYASHRGHTKIVQALIGAGADVHL